ncbi:MAG: GntR family transcriptional regulator [bacterium]
MARPRRHTLSPSALIAYALTKEIVSGGRPAGSKLPSQRALAKRFKTSQTSIARAFSILAADGYVRTRQGAGVFVLDRPTGLHMADCALLCMPAAGHIFSDLTELLHGRLGALGLLPATLDLRDREECLLRRALHSEVRFIIVTGGALFPFSAFDEKTLATKHVIAVLAWESDNLLDRVHRIIVDHSAGMRLLAKHLWDAGHRRVLLAGPPNMLTHAAKWGARGECPARLNVPGTGFALSWDRLGGQTIPFLCHHEHPGRPACDAGELHGIMTSRDAPTAVVGLRDVDAWDIQTGVSQFPSQACKTISFFGSGDTPWSRMEGRSFSSLDWNLREIADLATGVIGDIQAGKMVASPVVKMISPRLVLR